jgi:hypothetical protein
VHHFKTPSRASKEAALSIMEEIESPNFQLFRDCLSTPLIEKTSEAPSKSKKARNKSEHKTAVKPVAIEKTETSDADELAEFIDVCFSSTKISIEELTKNSISQMKYSKASPMSYAP